MALLPLKSCFESLGSRFMSLFQYSAIDRKGKKRKGVVDAMTDGEARQKLRGQGLMVSSLGPTRASWSSGGLSGEALVTTTVQLAQLLTAGVPIYEGLVILEEQERGGKSHPILLGLAEGIRGGSNLSEAMGNYPESFDSLYCTMVAAGEASGSLGPVLTRVAEMLKKRQKLQQQLLTALLYPAFLAGFCLIVIGVLLGYLVPSLEGIFEGRDVNAYTQAVIGVSHMVQDYGVYMLIAIFGLAGALFWQMQKPGVRRFFESVWLRTPVLKTFVIAGALARFGRTMETLQEGGVALVDALPMGSGVMRNHRLSELVDDARRQIVQGGTLSQELKKSPLMPKIVSSMIAIGEETGSLPVMWKNIADMYEDEVEKASARLTALAQPIILIVMGFIVGAVLLSVLLPLTDISALGV
jgi:general secretion pathway protein F